MKTKDFLKINAIKNNSSVNAVNPVIFTACAILGISIGVVCETINSDVYTTLDVLYDEYLNYKSCFSFLNAFINCTCSNLIYIIISMFFGLCAVGFEFLYLIPFFKGLGIGSVCSLIYSGYSIKGVFYCVLIVFPAALIQLLAIILSSSESCIMSRDLLRLINNKEKENTEINTRFYILRYSVITLMIVISALIYAFMTKIFFKVI